MQYIFRTHRILSHIRKALYKRVEVLVKISVVGLSITGVLEMQVRAGERKLQVPGHHKLFYRLSVPGKRDGAPVAGDALKKGEEASVWDLIDPCFLIQSVTIGIKSLNLRLMQSYKDIHPTV